MILNKIHAHHTPLDHPSSIPNPNNAKSYFTGSTGSNFRRFEVSSSVVNQSVCFRRISLSFRATRSTCRSHGQINCAGEIFFHSPKSTPRWSDLTIQRRYMFSLLQVDFRTGVAICFLVLFGKSGKLKKRSWNRISPVSVLSHSGETANACSRESCCR